MSFKIMETVRKGKSLDEETESYMRENGIPEVPTESLYLLSISFKLSV